MKIQEGKRYVRRDGNITGKIEKEEKDVFFGFDFVDPNNNLVYDVSGRKYIDGESGEDLVEEYIEPKWQEKIWFTEIDYIKPNKMENPTKEQVLKAAEKSQEVKEALMELYPEAFEDELEVGDLVMINGDVCIIGRCGFDELVPISINDGRYHTMTFSDVGSISDRLKEITHGSSIITKLNKSDYINVDKL